VDAALDAGEIGVPRANVFAVETCGLQDAVAPPGRRPRMARPAVTLTTWCQVAVEGNEFCVS
jgi:hypothetical protein